MTAGESWARLKLPGAISAKSTTRTDFQPLEVIPDDLAIALAARYGRSASEHEYDAEYPEEQAAEDAQAPNDTVSENETPEQRSDSETSR